MRALLIELRRKADFMVVEKVLMDLVDPPKVPARRVIDPENVRELAESIRERGQQTPITLRPVNGRYEIIAGHRRYLAHRFLGMPEILAVVKEMTEEDALVERATENLQREDLTPMEQARTYDDMRKKLGWGLDRIARKMGKAEGTIKKYVALLALDREFQDAIDAKKLGMDAAHILCQIDDPEFRKYYLIQAVENGVTIAVATMWVASYKASKEARLYEQGGVVGGVTGLTEDKPTYQTCGACDGPVNIKELRYVPLCPECVKQILRR